MSEGPLPYAELIEYAIQVTDALEAADGVGLMHGDIKPSNLLMAGPGCIKLGDFGLARRSGNVSQRRGGEQGTPNYLAPELLDGAAPDRRTDMYALGVTMFELAFGRLPYELSGSTLREQLMTHRTAEVQRSCNVGPVRSPRLFAKFSRDCWRRTRNGDMYRISSCGPIWSAPVVADWQHGGRQAGPHDRLVCGHRLSGDAAVALRNTDALLTLWMNDETRQQFDDNVPYVSVGMLEWLFGLLTVAGAFLIPLLALWWDLKRYRTPGRYLISCELSTDTDCHRPAAS